MIYSSIIELNRYLIRQYLSLRAELWETVEHVSTDVLTFDPQAGAAAEDCQ